jgi:hypothetical protein
MTDPLPWLLEPSDTRRSSRKWVTLRAWRVPRATGRWSGRQAAVAHATMDG